MRERERQTDRQTDRRQTDQKESKTKGACLKQTRPLKALLLIVGERPAILDKTLF